MDRLVDSLQGSEDILRPTHPITGLTGIGEEKKSHRGVSQLCPVCVKTTYSAAMTNDPATVDLVIPDPARPAGSGVMKRLQRKRKVVVSVLMTVVVMALMAIIVVLATLLITTQQPCTATPPTPPPTTRPPPSLSSIVGNNTAALPLAIQEQVLRQLQCERTLAGCRMVNVSLKVWELLPSNLKQDVMNGILLTHNIPVTRCQGQCPVYSLCQPMHAVEEQVVALYQDSDGALKYFKGEVFHHRLCRCMEGE